MKDAALLWFAALSLGYAAYALAIGIGIPHWVNWTSREVPADASDIGLLVAVAVLCLGRQA